VSYEGGNFWSYSAGCPTATIDGLTLNWGKGFDFVGGELTGDADGTVANCSTTTSRYGGDGGYWYVQTSIAGATTLGIPTAQGGNSERWVKDLPTPTDLPFDITHNGTGC
jgi:hypothetical protein